ncbi:MAG TPA: acyl-CoA dehydrogenase family protein [Acidimicrobiales bacterium]|nr:acyl-CoA dehydrogenase family protein [Acidimicrobiales bacterium]
MTSAVAGADGVAGPLASAEDFRRELRAWLDANFTPDVAAAVGHQGDDGDAAFAARRRWNATLVDAGYGAIAWPVEHGGRDAGLVEQLAYTEEMARSGAPGPVNAIGVANIAPALMAHGTAEQQARFLRPLLRGDDIWSQGMSEPDAGSDLASLRCRAERDGDHFVVDGQKTWNSNGHRADWCQLFVRTSDEGRKHQGITALLVDMRTPGIEARPIVTMVGDTGFADLWFHGARVPVSAVLGQVGEGWRVATDTLSHERAGVAGLYLGLRRKLDRLVAAAAVAGGAAADPVARDALARRHIEVRNLELLAKRVLAAQLAGRPPGPEGSLVKLAWSTTDQALSRTAVDVLGLAALDGPWARELLAGCSLTIAGGTTEVNKNIIAERVLGLPR